MDISTVCVHVYNKKYEASDAVTIVFSTDIAVVSASMELFRSGDHIIASYDFYGVK